MAEYSELARILSQYGDDYQNPLSQYDSADLDTRNVLAGMPKPNPVASALRTAAEYIPPNREHSISLANMLKGGLGSAANWLDGRPEVGPDTLAPFGLAAMGSHLLRLRSRAVGAEQAAPFRLTPFDGGDTFYGPLSLHVERGGEPIGAINYELRSAAEPNDTAFIHLMRLKRGSGEPLTTGDLRALREAFRELQPSVTRFEGQRSTGAHALSNPEAPLASPNRKQSVTIAADPLRASAPGTVVNGLNGSMADYDPLSEWDWHRRPR